MLDRLKLALIDEWKHAWKLWSVQTNLIGLCLMSFGEVMRDSWNALPDNISHRIPHAETIGIVIFALGLLVRVLRQVK